MFVVTYHGKSQVFFCDIAGTFLVGLKKGNIFLLLIVENLKLLSVLLHRKVCLVT